MNVLFIGNNLNSVKVFRLPYIDYYNGKSKFNFYIGCPRAQDLKTNNAELIDLLDFRSSILNTFRSFIILVNNHKSRDFDMVLSWAHVPNSMAIGMKLLFPNINVKVTVTGLGRIFDEKRFFLLKTFLKLQYRFGEKIGCQVIFQNKFDEKEIFSTSGKRMISPGSGFSISPNLVQSKPRKQDSDQINVILVSRFTREKRVELFYDLAKLFKARENWSFFHFGDIDDGHYTRSFVDLLAKECNVNYMGYNEHLENVYGQFDIQVSVSKREGIPRSLIEGFNFDLYVVGVAVPGVIDVIETCKNGMLVDADVSSLEKGLLSYFENHIESRGMSIARSEYSIDKILKIYLEDE